jgi:uncharacterized RDD family membrane protein YckC
MTDSSLQQKRLAAAAIDIGVLFVLGIALWGIGTALACSGALSKFGVIARYLIHMLLLVYVFGSLAFVLGRDILAGSASPGKKMMGIRVVTAAGAPIGVTESVKRNMLFAPGLAVVALLTLLGMIPIVGCVTCLLWPLRVLASVFGVVAGIYEIVMITQEPDGVRLGDKMAGTRVVI